MKAFISTITLIFILGCSTTQQTKTYNTLFSTEQTVTAAVDSYDTLVIKGLIATNDVPKVSQMYNDFQAAMKLAASASMYNTNAITPPALAVEAQDLVNLINTITKGK